MNRSIPEVISLAEPKNVSATGTQLLDRAVAILKYLGEIGEKGAKKVTISEAVGLKATTTDHVGPIGQGEALAAQAVALLREIP